MRRIASDWGWEFPCVQGIIRLATYDRRKGLANHQGALSKNLAGGRMVLCALSYCLQYDLVENAGNRWNPPDVTHEMIQSDPAFGLYSTDSF